jgi:hypothetical protein
MSKTVIGIAIIVPIMAARVTLKAGNDELESGAGTASAGEGQWVLLLLVEGFSRLDRPYGARGEAKLAHTGSMDW